MLLRGLLSTITLSVRYLRVVQLQTPTLISILSDCSDTEPFHLISLVGIQLIDGHMSCKPNSDLCLLKPQRRATFRCSNRVVRSLGKQLLCSAPATLDAVKPNTNVWWKALCLTQDYGVANLAMHV